MKHFSFASVSFFERVFAKQKGASTSIKLKISFIPNERPNNLAGDGVVLDSIHHIGAVPSAGGVVNEA